MAGSGMQRRVEHSTSIMFFWGSCLLLPSFVAAVTRASVAVKQMAVSSWTWNRMDTDGIRPASRQGHAALELGQRIYIIGGCKQEETCYNDVHIFDTESFRWSQEAVDGEAPEPRGGHSATLVGSDVVVFGGASNTETFGDVHRFDPIGRRWSRVVAVGAAGAGPGRRTGHAAAADERGRIWVFGGYDSDGNLLNDLWILSLSSTSGDSEQRGVTATWSKAAPTGPVPDARLGHTLSYVDGKLVTFGGYTSSGSTVNDVYGYDLETQRWSRLQTGGDLPGPRSAHSAVRHGRDLVVAGGCDVSNANPSCYSDVWSLSLIDMRWTQRSSDAITWFAREGHSAIFVRGRMFAFGGCTLSLCYNDMAALDTQDPCPDSCGHHGVCASSQFCRCTSPGFTGHDCMQPLICLADCGQNGACSQDGRCVCENGWTGANCNIELACPMGAGPGGAGPEKCSGQGICQRSGACHCNVGFGGAACNEAAAAPAAQAVPAAHVSMLQTAETAAMRSQGAVIRGGTVVLVDPFGRKAKKSDDDDNNIRNKDFGVHEVNKEGSVGSKVECPDNCNFRGFCEDRVCYCQPGFEGQKCQTTTLGTEGTLNLEAVISISAGALVVSFVSCFGVMKIRQDNKQEATL